MRKWSWLVVALVLMTGGSSAALAKGQSPTAAHPTCVVKQININPAGHVTVRGGCSLRGKSILSRPHYSYTSVDTDKYSCGLTTGMVVKGSKFVLRPKGAAAASGNVRYLPQGKYRRLASRAKPFQATMAGSGDLQCGKPVNLPPSEVLCDRSQWPLFGWPPAVVANCGQPVRSGLAFSDLTTLVDGVLTAGHVVSPSGRCAFGPWNHPDFDQPGLRLLCSDDVGAEVVLAYGLIADSQGNFCPDSLQPTYNGQRKMDIPKTWKGTLYIVAAVDSYANWSTTHDRIGRESQTMMFKLQGSQEAC